MNLRLLLCDILSLSIASAFLTFPFRESILSADTKEEEVYYHAVGFKLLFYRSRH